MWSVRMRASKFEYSREIHVSGAEGIFEFREIEGALKRFFKRAIEHKRGKAEKIVLTVEELKEPIVQVKSLPIKTVFCDSPEQAYRVIGEKLNSVGVSERAIFKAFEIITKFPMRGAALVDYLTGERLERDRERGIRVSRIQIDKKKRAQLLRKFKNLSSEPQRVIEALTIASKVAAFEGIVAELCISDNPDYTTGYIASKSLGYMRITNIKDIGDSKGGRVFFVKSPIDIEGLYKFLERTPVIVL